VINGQLLFGIAKHVKLPSYPNEPFLPENKMWIYK